MNIRWCEDTNGSSWSCWALDLIWSPIATASSFIFTLFVYQRRKKTVKVEYSVVVRTNKKSMYITRSMVKARQTSRVSCHLQSIRHVHSFARSLEILVSMYRQNNLQRYYENLLFTTIIHFRTYLRSIVNAVEGDSVRSSPNFGVAYNLLVLEKTRAVNLVYLLWKRRLVRIRCLTVR